MTSLDTLLTVRTELREDQLDLAGGLVAFIACAIRVDHCLAVLYMFAGD